MSAAFPSWWIYLIGPLAGAAFGGWIWQYLKQGRHPAEAEETGEDTEPIRQDAKDGQPARQRTGKFLVDQDPDGKYHFTLVAGNGQVIATSTAYERRQAALNGIEALKKNAPDAEIAVQGSLRQRPPAQRHHLEVLTGGRCA